MIRTKVAAGIVIRQGLVLEILKQLSFAHE
jgi:hypothetical protein